jgi:hypothetical protein
MLHVIEQQQQRTIAQIAQQLAGEVGRPIEREAERVGDHRRQQLGRGDRRKRHERDSLWATHRLCAIHQLWATRWVATMAGGHLERQAGLAHAARPGDRQQPANRVGQQVRHIGQLSLAPDERGRRGRQGRGAARRGRRGDRETRGYRSLLRGTLRLALSRGRLAALLLEQLAQADMRLKAGRANEPGAILGRQIEHLRHMLGDLLRRPPLATLDLADRLDRAADLIGEILLCKAAVSAKLLG